MAELIFADKDLAEIYARCASRHRGLVEAYDALRAAARGGE